MIDNNLECTRQTFEHIQERLLWIHKEIRVNELTQEQINKRRSTLNATTQSLNLFKKRVNNDLMVIDIIWLTCTSIKTKYISTSKDFKDSRFIFGSAFKRINLIRSKL